MTWQSIRSYHFYAASTEFARPHHSPDAPWHNAEAIGGKCRITDEFRTKDKEMNKEKMAQMRYKRVKIRPVARHKDSVGFDLEPVDEVWLIEEASKNGLTLHGEYCGQNVRLGIDYVREFMTDTNIHPKSDGFLKLKVQIVILTPSGYKIEPL